MKKELALTPLCLSNLASGLGVWTTERGTGLTIISALEFHTDRKMIRSGLSVRLGDSLAEEAHKEEEKRIKRRRWVLDSFLSLLL